MEIVINDFSLDGQFSSLEDFYKSLREYTLEALKALNEEKIEVLKSYELYERKVTETSSFYEVIQKRGEPEITRMKRLLTQMMLNPPYWNDFKKHNCEDVYCCNYSDRKNDYCLAEACERDKVVFSFINEKFKENTFRIYKNDTVIEIYNIYNKKILLDFLYDKNIIKECQYCDLYFNELKINFCKSSDRNYTMEFFNDNSLSKSDKSKILYGLKQFMFKMEAGEDLCRFSKSIYEDINEFRCSIDDKREVRIFYFRERNCINLLNGFIKKEQNLPKNEIEKARKLRKMF